MGVRHAVSGAAAWAAVTATVPYTLGLDPMPARTVVIGSLVTAGAALLPDADHHNGTIARSAGLLSQGVARAAEAASGGHRHGTHSALAVVGFSVATSTLGRWEATVPAFGTIPVGATLVLLALVAFAAKALRIARGGTVTLWVGAASLVVALLHFAPDQLTWLPLSVMVGVIVHLIGDMLTVGGVPLLWPWVPKPPRAWAATPVLNRIWMRNGYVALPVLGRTGSAREWLACAALTGYTGYALLATTGLITIGAV